MIIREAAESDMAAVANLHAESWRSAYRGILSDDYLENQVDKDRFGVWRKRFAGAASKPMFVIVADISTSLAGFACVFPDEDSVFGSFLDNLHVAPQLTGRGIGRLLLSESARRLGSRGSHAGLYLWVIERNHRALRFYEKAGAVVVGAAENSMPDGQRVGVLRCYWADPNVLLI